MIIVLTTHIGSDFRYCNKLFILPMRKTKREVPLLYPLGLFRLEIFWFLWICSIKLDSLEVPGKVWQSHHALWSSPLACWWFHHVDSTFRFYSCFYFWGCWFWWGLEHVGSMQGASDLCSAGFNRWNGEGSSNVSCGTKRQDFIWEGPFK